MIALDLFGTNSAIILFLVMKAPYTPCVLDFPASLTIARLLKCGRANHLIGKSILSYLYPCLHFVTRLFLDLAIVSR